MAAVIVTALLGAASQAAGATARTVAQPATPAAAAPVPTAASLDSVSCRSTSWCLAAGESATSHPYSALWNGTSWRALRTPAVADATSLTGVSCASESRCVAVGGATLQHPFTDLWNGRTWQLRTIGKQSMLLGVSCPAVSFCLAVGHTSIFAHAQARQAVAMIWNGSSWQAQALPAIPGAVSSSFTSVSCLSARQCTVVGYDATTLRGQILTLAEQWNGTSWQVESIPDVPPSGGAEIGDVLTGVSCASNGNCVAVGTVAAFGVPDQALAEAWDGHTWTLLPGADPAGDGTELTGVGCVASSCMAVGFFQTNAGGSGTLAERWDGHSWTVLTTPALASISLAAVSCTTASGCMAVGSGDSGEQTVSAGLSAQWNGHAWRTRRVDRIADLTSVSCDRAIGCMAAGDYVDTQGHVQTLTEQWNGRSWRQHRSPALPAADALTGVSCAGTSFCMAIGPGISMTWNGSSWQQRLIASDSTVTNVSCTSSVSCMAVGRGSLVTMHWNGRTWRALDTHLQFGSLTDVACQSAGWCMAIGISNFDKPMADLWNGSTWRSLHTLPAPSESFSDDLTGIACTSRANCLAVGSFKAEPKVFRNTAERWNGKTWRVVTVPGHGGLRDLSCRSAVSCLAVGNYISHHTVFNVAAQWTGKTWHAAPTPSPAGLVAVSCSAAANCVAVGQATSLTLASRWNGTRWQLLHTVNP